MLESIAFFLIFNLIRVFWWCHKDNKLAEESYGTQEECRQAGDWAGVMEERMEKKGLANYMMKDFQFKERPSLEEMKSEKLLEIKMTRMMNDLHQYLHLCPGYTLHVQFDREKKMDRAGQIDYVKRRIDIFPRDDYTAETLMAILAHETAHYFMYQNGLDESDRDLNERYTDTVACLMGLSSYMVAGNVGYLKKGQFVAVQNRLNGYRIRIRRQKKDSADNAEQDRLRNRLNAANALLQQTKAAVLVRKVPARTDLTVQDYRLLKQLTDQLNAGKYDRSLAFCKQLVNGNQTNLQTGLDDVMRVCEDLNTIMKMFG